LGDQVAECVHFSKKDDPNGNAEMAITRGAASVHVAVIPSTPRKRLGVPTRNPVPTQPKALIGTYISAVSRKRVSRKR
jgi:hypothetical protein